MALGAAVGADMRAGAVWIFAAVAEVEFETGFNIRPGGAHLGEEFVTL